MRTIGSKLPPQIKNPLRQLRSLVRSRFYYGTERLCPVCNQSFRRFVSSGIIPREDAQCVYCGSLERHRLLWLFLHKKTDLFDGKPKKMLHVAPEYCFETRFKRLLGSNYLTADLFKPHVMVKMDITDIQYPDQSFDVIYCSHVLEHVPDDQKAMQEFHRVLSKDGWAIILVPITSKKTVEDPSIVDPADRLRMFGQEDHVRSYGPDYIDRLRDAGFKVEVFTAGDLVGRDSVVRLGLTPASGEIFYCTK